MPTLTAHEFVDKWRHATLKERSASQEHFLDLCHLIGHATPAEADSTGESFAFEVGAAKILPRLQREKVEDTASSVQHNDGRKGSSGFADAWKKGYARYRQPSCFSEGTRMFQTKRSFKVGAVILLTSILMLLVSLSAGVVHNADAVTFTVITASEHAVPAIRLNTKESARAQPALDLTAVQHSAWWTQVRANLHAELAASQPASTESKTPFRARAQVPANFSASSGLNSTPVLTLTGESTDGLFGDSVASAGDVNGDGYADLVVGAAGYNSGQGHVYVYLGSANGLNATPALTLTGESANNSFGYSVASAGDVNGDGYADLVVGAYGYNSVQGRAYVYLGSASGTSATPALTLTGGITNNFFGYSVASAGDVNHDGYADLLVGAPIYNSSQGRAYVYLGSASGLSATPALTLTGETTSNNFGTSVASAGDVNGDSYADWVVGALGYNSLQGRAYVYLGSASGPNATPALTLTGETTGNKFGVSVASAGDMNGDGYADLVVSAPGYNSFNQGRAYVYLGSASGLSATPALTLTGETTSNGFGSSVASAGDMNGDGYAELVVGAPIYNSNQGRAYVYLGSASGLNATPALTLTGKTTDNSFGASVASAGNVNGNGYADLVVGAPRYNDFVEGRAYLYTRLFHIYLPLVSKNF